MTILHILKSTEFSGAENVACTIISGIPEDRCIYMSRKGSVEQQVTARGIEYYGVDKLSTKTIKEAIEKFAPDIIHAHDFTASILAQAAAKRAGIPVISHLHDNHPWMSHVNIKTIVYALSCRGYSKILTVSKSVGDEFIFKKAMAEKLCVVGNPFDMTSILTKSYDMPRDAKYESDILFVGRFTEQKNPQAFVRIIKKISEKKPDIKAIMLGRGELMDECVMLAESLGVAKNIDFKGFVDDPYLYMRQSHYLMMPSRWEGFGLVALESMAMGTPVMACPVGGLAEIVNDDCGRLCKTEDDFVNGYLEDINEPKSYVAKQSGAQNRACFYSNVNKYIGEIIKVYVEVKKARK